MTILNSKIININNHKTSIRLANGEWSAINTICYIENIKKNYLFELINNNKNSNIGLTSAVRIFCIAYLTNECLTSQAYSKKASNKQTLEYAISNII